MTTVATLAASHPASQFTPGTPVFYTPFNSIIQSYANRDIFLAGEIDGKVTSTNPLISEAANGPMGVITLISGNKVVSNSSITSTSRIFLTSQSDGGSPGWLRVSNRVVGTSFTITSSNSADTSTVAYLILDHV